MSNTAQSPASSLEVNEESEPPGDRHDVTVLCLVGGSFAPRIDRRGASGGAPSGVRQGWALTGEPDLTKVALQIGDGRS
jgi:hypothetical protein